MSLSDPSLSPKRSGKFIQTPAVKCCVCASAVFKVEEVEALGKSWHKLCFTCGGATGGDQGCARVLAVDTYDVYNKEPYCKACFNRNSTRYSIRMQESVDVTPPPAPDPQTPPRTDTLLPVRADRVLTPAKILPVEAPKYPVNLTGSVPPRPSN